jgi:hypothetical protein
MTHSGILLTIYALCVFRLTRLICLDTIADPGREWIRRHAFTTLEQKDGYHQVLAQFVKPRPGAKGWLLAFNLVNCPWCVSIWIAATVVPLAYFYGSWFAYVCLVPALSGVSGFLNERQ